MHTFYNQFICNHGTMFTFKTDFEAPRYRLVNIDITQPTKVTVLSTLLKLRTFWISCLIFKLVQSGLIKVEDFICPSFMQSYVSESLSIVV